MLKILVVDDHELVREAISHLLEREDAFRVICATGTLAEAMTCEEDPDVIVAEPGSFSEEHMGLDGPALVAALIGRYPGSRVLILAADDNPVKVESCLAAGASGYMVKKAPSCDLLDAVKKVAAGQSYLQPSLGAALIKRATARGNAGKSASELNTTERQILRELALGHTNSEVAKTLSFGLRTVEGYRSRIMGKLGVNTRAQLVKAAFEMDLIDLPNAKSAAIPTNTSSRAGASGARTA